MDQGGKIRTGSILRGLKGGAFDVTLASPAPRTHMQDYTVDIEAVCDQFVHWPDQPLLRLRRFLGLISHLPLAVATDQSSAGRATIRAALRQKPDVVAVDFPHADVLMPARFDAASVIFTHNVEAEIFERHAIRTRGIWRLIWADQSRKMTRFERNTLLRYNSVVAVSERDQKALEQRYGLSSVEAIDTGVDLDFFKMSPLETADDPGADGGTLVFTATMSWAANVDGIHFLLDEVFPVLRRVRPAIRAIIIGRNPPAALAEKVKERRLNVTFTGFVTDIRPYVEKANVYVVPLFIGSGTRIKVFEAMAMGRPVISTGLGVEGLDVQSGKHFIRADDAQSFSSAILALLDDAATCRRIAIAARRLMEDRFSWVRVAGQFEAICLRALGACPRIR